MRAVIVVVDGAKIIPSLRNGLIVCHVTRVLSQHDSKAEVQVPVDVAMQEPWAVVVSDKANGDVVASVSNGDDVAADGVLVVVYRASGASNDREGMTMKMERMGSAVNASRHRDFNDLVRWESVNATLGEHALRALGTAEDLEEDGNGGGLE